MPLPSDVEKVLAKLAQLIRDGRWEEVETDTVEVKPVPPSGGEWKERWKSVNAFLNTRGGALILGIRDEGSGPGRRYVHSGWRPAEEGKLKDLKDLFTTSDGTKVALSDALPHPFIVPFMDGQVAVQLVDELPADRKYVFFEGAAYQRIATGDNRIKPAQLSRQEEYREEAAYARELLAVPGLTEDALDVDKLNRYLMQLNQLLQVEVLKPDIASARPFLERKMFLVDGKVTTLGALVCAKHPGDVLGFRAQVHSYVDVPQEVARDKQDYVDNVLQLMGAAYTYLGRNTAVGVSAREGGTSVPEYPDELLRETVNNALAHRDYSINRHVIVAIKPHAHIIIQNPGRFRPHVLIEQPNDAVPLRRILPEAKPQNPKLADVLRVYRKWEGRGIGMATLVSLALENRIDLPYYTLQTEEIQLTLPRGQVLDERMERLFAGYAGYLEEKLNGVALTQTQKRVLSYLVKSEWANEKGRYSVLLTAGNNHFEELESLKRAGLISIHPASPTNYPVYVVDRTIMQHEFTTALRERFGDTFVGLSAAAKDALGLVYRTGRYGKGDGISAKEAARELWSMRNGGDDINAFDDFYRAIRRAFNELTERRVVERTRKTQGYILRRPNNYKKIGRAKHGATKATTTPRGETSARRADVRAKAAEFMRSKRGRHTVEEVRSAIRLPDTAAGRNQARNILVRLKNEGGIRRLAPGIYERAPKKN